MLSITHLMVTVTSSILSVVISPVMWCLTAVRVKMLGADLRNKDKNKNKKNISFNNVTQHANTAKAPDQKVESYGSNFDF